MDIFSKLGFDLNSIVLYIINVALLLGVLSYLLYPKILHFLDERKKLIADSVNEANRLKESFEKKIEEMEREKKENHRKMQKEMDQLMEVVQQKKAELIKEAEKERESMMASLQEEMKNYRQKSIAESEKEVLALLQQIIVDFVNEKVPTSVIQESISTSWNNYKKSL